MDPWNVLILTFLYFVRLIESQLVLPSGYNDTETESGFNLDRLAVQSFPDTLSEENINRVFCRGDSDCTGDERCEKVCMWRFPNEAFVGCKIMCVVTVASKLFPSNSISLLSGGNRRRLQQNLNNINSNDVGYGGYAEEGGYGVDGTDPSATSRPIRPTEPRPEGPIPTGLLTPSTRIPPPIGTGSPFTNFNTSPTRNPNIFTFPPDETVSADFNTQQPITFRPLINTDGGRPQTPLPTDETTGLVPGTFEKLDIPKGINFDANCPEFTVCAAGCGISLDDQGCQICVCIGRNKPDGVSGIFRQEEFIIPEKENCPPAPRCEPGCGIVKEKGGCQECMCPNGGNGVVNFNQPPNGVDSHKKDIARRPPSRQERTRRLPQFRENRQQVSFRNNNNQFSNSVDEAPSFSNNNFVAPTPSFTLNNCPQVEICGLNCATSIDDFGCQVCFCLTGNRNEGLSATFPPTRTPPTGCAPAPACNPGCGSALDAVGCQTCSCPTNNRLSDEERFQLFGNRRQFQDELDFQFTNDVRNFEQNSRSRSRRDFDRQPSSKGYIGLDGRGIGSFLRNPVVTSRGAFLGPSKDFVDKSEIDFSKRQRQAQPKNEDPSQSLRPRESQIFNDPSFGEMGPLDRIIRFPIADALNIITPNSRESLFLKNFEQNIERAPKKKENEMEKPIQPGLTLVHTGVPVTLTPQIMFKPSIDSKIVQSEVTEPAMSLDRQQRNDHKYGSIIMENLPRRSIRPYTNFWKPSGCSKDSDCSAIEICLNHYCQCVRGMHRSMRDPSRCVMNIRDLGKSIKHNDTNTNANVRKNVQIRV